MNHDTKQLWWRAFVFPSITQIVPERSWAGFVAIYYTTGCDISCSAGLEALEGAYTEPNMGKAIKNIILCWKKESCNITQRACRCRRGCLAFSPESLGWRYNSKKQRKGSQIAVVSPQLIFNGRENF